MCNTVHQVWFMMYKNYFFLLKFQIFFYKTYVRRGKFITSDILKLTCSLHEIVCPFNLYIYGYQF